MDNLFECSTMETPRWEFRGKLNSRNNKVEREDDKYPTMEISQIWNKRFETSHNSRYQTLIIGGHLSTMTRPKEVKFSEMDWFLNNFNELSMHYGEQWLAIFNNKVVAYGDTPVDLKKKLLDEDIQGAFITRASSSGWGNR
jgi:hypothetical protein